MYLEAHFACRTFNLVKQILGWMCCCESDLPLGYVLQQVKIIDENCSIFFLSLSDYTVPTDNLHTSSSKNPERSRDDAIPIN